MPSRRRPRGTTASTAAWSSTTSTRCRSAGSRSSCPTYRADPELVGDAVPPGGGHQHRRVHRAPRSAPGCGSSSSRATPTTRSGWAATGARRPRRRPWRKSVPPGVNGVTFQTTLKNGIVVSDVPGPTGGILIQTTTGAMISVSDVGIVISQRQGRDDQHGRPDRRHQRRRADGDLSVPGPAAPPRRRR